MAEFATLGLAIESQPADTAVQRLDKLTGAAGRVEPAVKKAGDAATGAAAKFGSVATAVDRLMGPLDRIEGVLKLIEANTRPLAAGLDKVATAEARVGASAADAATKIAVETRAINEMATALAKAEARIKAYQTANDNAQRSGWAGLSAPTSGGMTIGARLGANLRAEDRLRGLGQPARPRAPAPVAAGGFAAAAGLNRGAVQNFGFQANDVVGGVMMGQSLQQVAMQQSGQVLQILQSSEKGVVGSIKGISGWAVRAATSVAGLSVGVAALGAVGAAAYADWLGQQKELERSLVGVGRGTALTAQGLNDLALANASAGGVSNATAREIAGTYAATGKIGTDVLGKLIAATRDYAATTGQEIPEASAELAKAFADPSRGADLLNGKLGILDASQKRTIDRLTAIGDAKGAQRALYAAMVTGIDEAGNRLTWLGRVWEGTKSVISNSWTGMFDGPSLQQQREALQKQIDAASRGISGPRGAGNALGGQAAAVAKLRADLKALDSQIASADERSRSQALNRRSITAQEYIAGFEGAENAARSLEIQIERMKGDVSSGAVIGKDFALAQAQIAKAEEALKSLRDENGRLLSDFDRAKTTLGLQLEGVTARTAEERAGIARRQYLEGTRGQQIDPKVREFNADAASRVVLAQAREDDKRYREQQAETRRQSFEQQRAELVGIGQTAEAQDRLRKEIELTAEARRRAYELTGSYNNADLTGIRAQAAEYAKLQAQIRRAGAADDAIKDSVLNRFDDRERNIRSRFDLDAKGEIIDANDKIIAQQMRQNELVRDMQQSVRGTGSELLGAWEKGESGLDVMLNKVKSIANDRLGKMIDDQLSAGIDQMMGGLVPGIDKIAKPSVSTPMMNVQAASVVIGGAGVNTLVGSLGGAANANGVTGGGVPSFSAGAGQYTEMIRNAALRYGIDPEVALRVAKSEGGTNGWIQSGVVKNGVREPSYGPFQALVGGNGTGFRAGQGNAMLAQGIDPRDPSQAAAVIDWQMKYASQNGWGEWYGAAKAGIGNRQGIGRGPMVGGVPMNQITPMSMQQTTPLEKIDVAGVNRSLTTMAEKTDQVANNALPALGQSAAQSAGGLGQFGQTLGNMMTSLGGAIGSAVGGKYGGAIGMLGGSLLQSGFGPNGWLSNILGSGINFGFATGGYTGDGGVNQPAGIVHKGEYVLPQSMVRAMGGPGGVEGMISRPPMLVAPQIVANQNAPSQSAKVEWHVHGAPSGFQTKEETDDRGNKRFDIFFDESAAQAAGAPGSRFSRQMRTTFGAKAQVRRR